MEREEAARKQAEDERHQRELEEERARAEEEARRYMLREKREAEKKAIKEQEAKKKEKELQVWNGGQSCGDTPPGVTSRRISGMKAIDLRVDAPNALNRTSMCRGSHSDPYLTPLAHLHQQCTSWAAPRPVSW